MPETTEEGHRIGHSIRKLRELRNLSQDYLAEQLNMSTSGYSRIERNEVRVSTDKLVKLSEVLDVSVEDILSFDVRFIFNNHGTANGYSFSKNSINVDIEQLDRLYREQIDLLKEEVAHLRALVKDLTASKR